MENTTLLPPPQVTYPNPTVTHSVEYEILWILTMVMYSLSFVLGVTGNGLVIFITGFRMKKTVNTIWFLNLAIADFTFTSFLPLGIAYLVLNFRWPFGEAMCKFNGTVLYINLCASVYLLTVISIDRCISVWCPVWAQNHRTPRLASFVALGVWILAFMLSSPIVQNGNVTCCYTNFVQDEEKERFAHRAVIISRFIFAFVIPFTVIIVCYGAIVLRLRRDRLAPSSKPFKVITAVIVAFFICSFPYHIFSFLETQVQKNSMLCLVCNISLPLASILVSINNCLKPILYFFMGHDFKEGLKHSSLSVFENAFTEETSQNTMQTKTQSYIEQDPHTYENTADLCFPNHPLSCQEFSVSWGGGSAY